MRQAPAGNSAPGLTSSELCVLQPIPSPLCAADSSFVKWAGPSGLAGLVELVSSTPVAPAGPRLEVRGIKVQRLLRVRTDYSSPLFCSGCRRVRCALSTKKSSHWQMGKLRRRARARALVFQP